MNKTKLIKLCAMGGVMLGIGTITPIALSSCSEKTKHTIDKYISWTNHGKVTTTNAEIKTGVIVGDIKEGQKVWVLGDGNNKTNERFWIEGMYEGGDSSIFGIADGHVRLTYLNSASLVPGTHACPFLLIVMTATDSTPLEEIMMPILITITA